MSDANMTDANVPTQTPATPAPATLDPARDLRAERDAERERERSEQERKKTRFTARKMTIPDRPKPAAPEFETYMFESAANNPFMSLKDTSPSTYVPNLSTVFYMLMYMDHLMANTKRWVDNCLGWAPPISQAYIGILCYVQIMRAMDAASAIGPNHEFSIFLQTFGNIFPLNDLWIPGPLVAFFRNISAFWPSSSDQFGNVTPIIPPTPGWTNAGHFRLRYPAGAAAPESLGLFLPNIAAYISRFRYIVGTAMQANMTQANFSVATDGPSRCAHMFQAVNANGAGEQLLMQSPGMSFAYPENLQVWLNAGYRINANSIPADLNVANPVSNDWNTFFRFDNNQHQWFASAAAIMAKYSQFFNGSAPLAEIMPNCSAAGAVKLRQAAGTDIHTVAPWVAPVVGPPAVLGYYNLRNNARVVLNARISVEDVPTAHVYAAVTYALNAYDAAVTQNVYRQGRFWSLGPDTDGRENIEVLPGTLTTIVRRYHSDVRIAAEKQ
jgi:hypothetical protein